MRKTIDRISAFGLGNYLEKKLYNVSPWLYHRLISNSAGFVRTAYGVEMWENWDDSTFRMCCFGSHGRQLSDIVANLKIPFQFVDVGANQGLFSLLAARNQNCTKVIAFEPVPRTFSLLDANINHNCAQGKIEPVLAAISGKSGMQAIAVPMGHSGGASIAARFDRAADHFEIRTLSAPDLTVLLSGADDLFVKIDVEGHEAVVLEQLLQMEASQRISYVYCEIDVRWVDYEQIATLLKNAGLNRISKLGSGNHFDILATRDFSA
ncbi:FkbM family methyltransferase [Pseudorhodobacter sp. W20_MBD10_FR17]|uniref:FkbM family methyltransferase n=1 Tax=Pseudorhodobacter sp. W20_MBD10_FR17 TaxID=3240266 RepID=UPI003F96B2A4